MNEYKINTSSSLCNSSGWRRTPCWRGSSGYFVSHVFLSRLAIHILSAWFLSITKIWNWLLGRSVVIEYFTSLYKRTCIRPAELPCGGVVGQSVGQPDAVPHQNPPVLAVHGGAFDFRSFSIPVSPVEGSVRNSGFTNENSASVSCFPTTKRRKTKPLRSI